MKKHGVNATGGTASGSSEPIQAAAPYQPVLPLLLVLFAGTIVEMISARRTASLVNGYRRLRTVSGSGRR